MSDPKNDQQQGTDPDELPDGSGPNSETPTGGDDDQFQG